MDKFELIRRNTQEIVSEAELKKLLSGKKKVKAYVGYAPTGALHIGHLFPFCKLVDLLDAGIELTFLTADLHAYLDDKKTPWDKLDKMSEEYEATFKSVIKSLGGDLKKIKVVKGSDYQLKPEYFTPILQMAGNITLARAKRAASEVVRFGDEPKLGGFLYPLMQAQDVAALDADIAFGGIDQRGIYMLSREILPEFGHKKPVCIFTSLLPGLSGGKMSASVPSSRISLDDSEKEIRSKVEKAFCPAQQVNDNGVLLFFKHVVFPTLERKKKKLLVKRHKKFGGDAEFKSYSALEQAYKKDLHPMDLKNAMADFLIALLAPIRR